jgi:hypothetical protein
MRRGVAWTALAVVFVACGGSGGSDDDGPMGEEKSGIALAFTADAPNPGPESTALAIETLLGDTAGLRVSVQGVDDVHSASLDVTFDPAHLDFVDWSKGELLEAAPGPNPFYVVVEQPGRVVIGVSLSGTGSGVDVSTPATLLRLTFRALTPGSSHLGFENMALLDAQAIPQEIGGVAWYGGTLSAN